MLGKCYKSFPTNLIFLCFANNYIPVLVSYCRFGVSPVNYPDPDPVIVQAKKVLIAHT